jgi:hypothetical protein
MITAWTKHIKDPEKKETHTNRLLKSRWVLDELATIIKDTDQEYQRAEISPRAYDLPNWDYKQAHSNGYRQCLRDVLNIINLDQRETNDR